MVKIFFYGGCHALVLRDIFQLLFKPDQVETALVINFQLIASGRPFPQDLLEWSDVVVFSPIENKGDYNTDRFAERCRAAQTQPVCFPWLEWRGYCPGAEKGFFKGRYQWFYPGLVELAASCDSFASFRSSAIDTFPSHDTIDDILSRTQEKVREAELRHGTHVTISDFIQTHYRTKRLFLISDHPSLAIYMHVVEQIAEQVGLRIPTDALSAMPPCEPQWKWRTPIFPRVAERLGLEFTDTEWRDDELLPHRVWPLDTYLSLYFHKDSVILGPLEKAGLYSPGDESSLDLPIEPDTRIFADPRPNAVADGLTAYSYLETLAGQTISLDPHALFRIDSKRWRTTWEF